MKAIINGLRYDTEKAELIATRESGLSRSDFSWLTESLYRTERGNWFTAGEGGAKTYYREEVEGGNAYRSGERIFALTEEEAQGWLEVRNEWALVEKWFGGRVEDA